MPAIWIMKRFEPEKLKDEYMRLTYPALIFKVESDAGTKNVAALRANKQEN